MMHEEEDNIKPEHLELAYLKLKNEGKFDFSEMDVRQIFDE